jgi:tripartite-type tricarboxylate transporter receptor subunit TctC
MFASLGPALPYMKSGRIRVLGVTTTAPSALVAGVPTVAQMLPGFVLAIPTSVFAPAKTSEGVIKRLANEFQRALGQPDVRDKLTNTGSEVVGSTPEELGSFMKADIARLSKVIKDAGLRERP